MKKTLSFLLFITLAVAFISCGDDSTTDPIEESKGSLEVSSQPLGAKIMLDGVETNFVTPKTFTDKEVKDYTITLSFDNYRDTSLTAAVLKDQTTTVDIELTPEYEIYGPITLWESLDPSTNHPSGLSLKLGKAFSIAQSKDSSAYNDIYYNSEGFLVFSADNREEQNAKMTRVTFFKEGASTVLTDGTDAPEKTATWTKSIKDDVRNYIYLYDEDGHYSKLIITEKNAPSGLTAKDGNIKVKWIYNKVANSTKF